MNICIHRMVQKEFSGVTAFCREDKSRCSSLRQVACTVPEFWPLYLIAALVLGSVVAKIVI